jgi:hypothetical protein
MTISTCPTKTSIVPIESLCGTEEVVGPEGENAVNLVGGRF